MHEQDKLDEAQHFLQRMGQSPEPKTFRYELSAFLSAARSALQYALEEARNKPGGQAWYEAQVSGNAVVRFFKDKRNISIHRQPVVPTTSVSVRVTQAISLSGTVHLQVIDAENRIIQDVSVGAGATGDFKDVTPGTATREPPSASLRLRYAGGQPNPSPHPTQRAAVAYSYSFADWIGSEDVLALSMRYLGEAQAIVNDGLAKGYLIR